jgi:hypothetical protein
MTRFPLRISGVVIVSIFVVIAISLFPNPVTFGTSVPQTVTVVVSCPPGSYLPPTRNPANTVEECLPCPAGYYCPNPGMVGDPGSPGGPIPCPAADSCPVGSIEPLAPIPEYPLGLAVLAIFMILAYGVIRRKTITIKQK